MSIRNENSDETKTEFREVFGFFGGGNKQLTILILNSREIVAFQILVRNGKFQSDMGIPDLKLQFTGISVNLLRFRFWSGMGNSNPIWEFRIQNFNLQGFP